MYRNIWNDNSTEKKSSKWCHLGLSGYYLQRPPDISKICQISIVTNGWIPYWCVPSLSLSKKTPHMLKRQAATLPIYSDCEPSLVQLTHVNFLFKSHQHFFKLGFNIGHTSNPTISFSLGLVSSLTFIITVNIRQIYRVIIWVGLIINQMYEYGSRFSGGPSGFHRTQVPFQQRKIQVTRIFRTMSSKVVGFYEDATELLGFHFSENS